MVWSEQVGTSIVLPTDRVDGDGRNYIVLGEDIPVEVASAFTAALVFRSGRFNSNDPDGMYPNGFVYWVFGISTVGSLEVVAYYYTVSFPIGGTISYFRRTMLSIAPPVGVDNPPVLSLGYNPNYASYGEGLSRVVQAGPLNVSEPAWDTYTPTWTCIGGSTAQPTIGNGTVKGRFRRIGQTCHFSAWINFGSTTNAANGSFALTLPLPAASGREHYVNSKCFTSDSQTWGGYGYIASGTNVSIVQPFFPRSATETRYGAAQSCTAGTNSSGTGIPLVTGNFPFLGGSNLYVSGTYEIASGF